MAEFLNFKGDYTGLSDIKADENLTMYGENLFAHTQDRSIKPASAVFNPLTVLLLVCAVLYWAVQGDAGCAVACFLLAALSIAFRIWTGSFCNKVIGRRTMAAEMKYRVIRNSEILLIPARYIVPDDLIIVQAGEMVPADAHLLEIYDLTADESIFTDRIEPKSKKCGADAKNTEVKETCIYAGTRILSGGAVARVTATGEDTLRAVKSGGTRSLPDPNYTDYEKSASRVILPLVLSGAVISTAAFVIGMIFGTSCADIASVLSACGRMLCFIPASVGLFVRLYSVFAWKRIGQKGATFKNIKVMEHLNALDVIVIDKSAVVAPNMLEVAGVYSKNNRLMTTVTVLACDRENTTLTEQAFLLDATLGGGDVQEITSNELICEFKYNDNDRIGGNIYMVNGKRLVCVKGSAEKITSLCTMSTDELFEIQQRAAALAKRGLEVWASAYAILEDEDELPKSLYSIKYTYMGLAAYMNATRDMLPLAVQGCRRAGVRLVLTSPDSPETADAMGKKIGLSGEGMITGDAIREASASGTTLDYAKAEIFCHITSEQKIQVIEGLKNAGLKVAAIGHGASDYEVLKHCDVGITTLENTTGCVYETSGVIMSDDSFGGIVEVIKEARQLHRNIKKSISVCITALTAMIILALADIISGAGAVSPGLAGAVAVILIPVCAMSFIGNTADLKSEMTVSGFIGRGVMDKSFFVGSIASGAVIGAVGALFEIICRNIMTTAQTASVLAVFISFAVCAYAFFSSGKNHPAAVLVANGSVPKRTPGILLGTAFFFALITYIPFIGGCLGFQMPHPVGLILAALCGVACNIWIEIKKYMK